MNRDASPLARRSFIKDSGLMIAGGAIGGAIAVGKAVHGGKNAPIKIAIVGCGRRGRELADAALAVPDESVQIVAIADVLHSQTQAAYRSLKGRYEDRLADSCLRSSGSDCLDGVLATDADVVYLATPPVDRPEQFARVVAAGKHVFLEKPLAADVAGVMSMVATAKEASESGLSVHVGFQRRYDDRYRDVIAKIQEGAIGIPVFARAFCNAGPLRKPVRNRNENDAEFRRRNWNHFQSAGGDFLIEQHVAGLDVLRWALDRVPVIAQGQGGWTEFDVAENSSDSRRLGDVFDHHNVEFQFEDGLVLFSQCRRVAKAWNHTSEHIHGTEGRADLTAGKIYSMTGELAWQSEKQSSAKAATLAQQTAFFASIRIAKPESQVESAADSTLFAMLGHRASRTSKRIRYDKLLNEVSLG